MAFITCLAVRSRWNCFSASSPSTLTPLSQRTHRLPLQPNHKLQSPAPQRQFKSTTPTMLKEGEKAPSFSAEDTDGNTISSDDLSGSNVVLYFSNASGMVCSTQSCSFRDAEAQFNALDAKIIAVSAQGPGASASFKQSNGLTFPVIPDKDGKLQKLFDVPSTFGLVPGRLTFVIDKEGVIRLAHNSQFSAGSHITMAKKTLKSI